MARYEVSDGTSHKFWEITLAGATFTVRWGRIGSRGQQTIKHWPDEARARREYDRLVAEKRRKGYRLVPGTEEPALRQRRGAVEVTAAGSGLRNADLERAVVADPGDEAALLVLADWLQTEGDPRGELIALQHALKHERDPKQFLDRKRAAEAHFAAHEPALLGPLHAWRHLFKLEWQLGFIRTARVSMHAARPEDPPIAEIVDRLLALPAALALQELTLGTVDGGRDRYQPVLDVLARRAGPRSLRTLVLGDFWPGTKPPAAVERLGDIVVLEPAYELRKLVVDGGVLAYGELPELRHFEHRAVPDAATLRWLLRGSRAQLEHLRIGPGSLAYDAVALVDAARFPRLAQLRLLRTYGTAALIEALAASRLLAQLELLDLADGDLDDNAAARLVELWPAFRHLKTFRLGFQQLTYGATKRLRERTGVQVNDPRMYSD